MKYAVCTGNSIEYGATKKSGNDTTVILKNYTAGDVIDFDDKQEIKRLVDAGIIRPLEHQAVVEEGATEGK